MTDLFAIFLKIEGRACLVVGAGRVAESKIAGLVRCGGKVRVVAPKATPTIREAARKGAIAWEQRVFRPSDLAGVFLVVAATPSPELHAEIFAQAQREGVLCNAVDEPERCDFYYPAVVRRGPLQIAVSTSGRFPALAQRLRQEFEQRFGPEYGEWIEEIGRARSELLAANISPEERGERLRELCGEEALEEFRRREQAAISSRQREGAGKVYFVGAGPGDPELLTRKAWRILAQAEVVLHDALVGREILRLAPPHAAIYDVGKRCGRKSITQEQIHARMIEQARAGRSVVRLQGGDPLIFGRAGEEIAALREAGVEFEIVPGVTAASAAAAAAQITLTDRRQASRLIFLSAHRHAGEFDAAWKSLSSSSASLADATLAIYMPGGDYEKIAHELRNAGLVADTPCLLVSQASTADQVVLRMDLASLASAPEVPAPALLLVGEVTREEALEAIGAYRAGTWVAGQAAKKEFVI